MLAHRFTKNVEKPISFESHSLTAEKNYSSIHREALTIVWAVTTFYQQGRQFIVKSDHKPLLTIFGQNKTIQKIATGCIRRWAFFLSGFDYKIEFIKDVDNLVADSLFRLVSETNDNVQKHENSEVVNWVKNILQLIFVKLKLKPRKPLFYKK